jgi:hypothetical protein
VDTQIKRSEKRIKTKERRVTQKAIAVLIAALWCWGTFAEDDTDALEDIITGHAPNSMQLPYELVVDAGVSAAELNDRQLQLSFVSSYASGAEYALKDSADSVANEYQLSQRDCLKDDDQTTKAMRCGYAAGIDAVLHKHLVTSLRSLGYLFERTRARIHVQGGALIYVVTKRGPAYVDSYAIDLAALKRNGCYELAGYLSREGLYGPSGEGYHREYFLTAAKVAKYARCQ